MYPIKLHFNLYLMCCIELTIIIWISETCKINTWIYYVLINVVVNKRIIDICIIVICIINICIIYLCFINRKIIIVSIIDYIIAIWDIIFCIINLWIIIILFIFIPIQVLLFIYLFFFGFK